MVTGFISATFIIPRWLFSVSFFLVCDYGVMECAFSLFVCLFFVLKTDTSLCPHLRPTSRPAKTLPQAAAGRNSQQRLSIGGKGAVP